MPQQLHDLSNHSVELHSAGELLDRTSADMKDRITTLLVKIHNVKSRTDILDILQSRKEIIEVFNEMTDGRISPEACMDPEMQEEANYIDLLARRAKDIISNSQAIMVLTEITSWCEACDEDILYNEDETDLFLDWADILPIPFSWLLKSALLIYILFLIRYHTPFLEEKLRYFLRTIIVWVSLLLSLVNKRIANGNVYTVASVNSHIPCSR